MALPHVKCTVSSCMFWKSGEKCDASAIEVNVDGGGSNANRSDQTNCHTFKQK